MFLRKLIIILLISLFLTEEANSQVNLVINPSFENLSSCPSSAGQIIKAINWNRLITGGGGTPDLFNACSTSNQVGVPVNFNGLCFQYPHSGNGYIGIQVIDSHSPNQDREYIQSKLLYPLVLDNVYCVTFYVNLQNRDVAYIKTIGAYLDSGNVSSLPNDGIALVTPQVYNTSQSLNDTLNWMKIQGSFTATGIESYITLGNFFPDSTSGIGFIGTPTTWTTYYLLDDISVIDVSTPAYAGNDTLIHLGDSVFVGRPPEVGLNEDCVWYVNNVAIDTVAGMWVKPAVPTTYVLKQTICGTTTYDSIHVNIYGAGINNYQLSTVNYQLSPNPSTGSFAINIIGEVTNSVIIEITDITGKLISKENIILSNNSALIDRGLTNGMYFITVKDTNGNKIGNPKKITVIR